MTNLAVILWVICTQDLGGWAYAIMVAVALDLLYLGWKLREV